MPRKDGGPVTPDTKMTEIEDLTPEEAAEIFATEYDDSIHTVRHMLSDFADMSTEDFHKILVDMKAFMEGLVPLPKDLTVAGSSPYVELSDLLTLGKLAHILLQRAQLEIELNKIFKS